MHGIWWSSCIALLFVCSSCIYGSWERICDEVSDHFPFVSYKFFFMFYKWHNFCFHGFLKDKISLIHCIKYNEFIMSLIGIGMWGCPLHLNTQNTSVAYNELFHVKKRYLFRCKFLIFFFSWEKKFPCETVFLGNK